MSDATFAISLYLEALHSEYPAVAPVHMATTGMLCVTVSFAQGRTIGPSFGYRIRQFSFHPHTQIFTPVSSGHLETLFTAAYQPLYADNDMLHSPLGFPIRISRGMTGVFFTVLS